MIIYFIYVIICAENARSQLLLWENEISFPDVFLTVVCGEKPFDPLRSGEFKFPYVQFLLEMLPVCFMAYSVYHDWKRYGKVWVPRFQSRRKWWMYETGKCVRYSLVFTMLLWAGVLAVTFAHGGSMLPLHEEALRCMDMQKTSKLSMAEMIWYGAGLRFMVYASVCEVMLLMQLKIQDVLSILFPMLLMVGAACFENSLLVSEILFSCRWKMFAEHGIDGGTSFVLCAMLFVGAFLLGRFLINRKEFL